MDGQELWSLKDVAVTLPCSAEQQQQHTEEEEEEDWRRRRMVKEGVKLEAVVEKGNF